MITTELLRSLGPLNSKLTALLKVEIKHSSWLIGQPKSAPWWKDVQATCAVGLERFKVAICRVWKYLTFLSRNYQFILCKKKCELEFPVNVINMDSIYILYDLYKWGELHAHRLIATQSKEKQSWQGHTSNDSPFTLHEEEEVHNEILNKICK